ncbi:DNA polymerase sliding clamp [uncultured archaeon]|nr:DNA polymerase sliding clamp [uncultured archaeon]
MLETYKKVISELSLKDGAFRAILDCFARKVFILPSFNDGENVFKCVGDCIFEIILDDAKVWKKCIDAIVNLVKEGAFEVDKDGIRLMAMDPSQISMLSFTMQKSAFSKYEVSEKAKIGLNMENFGKVMGRMRVKEKMVLKYDGKGKLDVTFIADKNTREFKLPLIDVAPGPSKALQIDYTATVKLKGSVMKEILKDAALVSPHVLLVADQGRFKVEATGDSADVDLEFQGGEVDVQLKKTTSAVFSREYLDDITRGCDEDGDVTLHLGAPTQTDPRPKPLKVEYKLGDGAFTFFLAPRIETD